MIIQNTSRVDVGVYVHTYGDIFFSWICEAGEYLWGMILL